MKIKCKQNSFINKIMAMKKRFPSITLLSPVTISLNLPMTFYKFASMQILIFSPTPDIQCIIACHFGFLHHLLCNFFCGEVGGGGLIWIWMLHVHGHVYFLIGKQGKKSLFSKLIIQISDCGWSLKLSANWHNNC